MPSAKDAARQIIEHLPDHRAKPFSSAFVIQPEC